LIDLGLCPDCAWMRVAKGENVESELIWWQCQCGQRSQLSREQLDRGTEVCPHCGKTVGAGSAECTVGDTMIMNVGEMARIAQAGVELSTSGEWDTLPIQEEKKDGEEE
jgi:hypothetical protein